MYYINLFFLYAFLGHLLEKIIFPQHVSGILYGFWTPIYGIGSLIIIISYQFISKKLKLNGWTKPILTFLIGFLFLSTIEFIGGTLIELIFHITFWNYSNMKWNIGKYASLEMGFLWGLASLILIYIIQPLLHKITLKIPKWITATFIILFTVDLFLTIFLRAK